MNAFSTNMQATSIIDLKAVCFYFEPYQYKHQVLAVNWLQTQLPYPIFREFTQRWEDEVISPDPVLQIKSWGAAVFELQQMLNKTGTNLVTDGEFGSKTEAAVMRFQRNNALTIDGVVGNMTWAKLREILEPRYLWQMFDSYNVEESPHQDPALSWLQKQISTTTLTEFAHRWRNP
ncbi:MAG: peptidoglycan-binding protein [Oculatellaceae cyanobacterium Prado106]|nr:peptidoglycan-binding protein [Oculatellaceae cyanobacterium Prado106]